MDMPPSAQPVAAPAGRKFPCDQCGARLDFDPSGTSLKCPYCGHSKHVYTDYTAVQERDFQAFIERGEPGPGTIPGRSEQVSCGGCGAVVLLEDHVATDKCPFCATHLESQPQAAEAMIEPESILPFAVDYRKAKDAFERWINDREAAAARYYRVLDVDPKKEAAKPLRVPPGAVSPSDPKTPAEFVDRQLKKAIEYLLTKQATEQAKADAPKGE